MSIRNPNRIPIFLQRFASHRQSTSIQKRVVGAVFDGITLLIFVLLSAPFILTIIEVSVSDTLRTFLLDKEHLPLLTLYGVDVVIYVVVTVLLILQSYSSIQKERHNRRWDLLRLGYLNPQRIVIGMSWARLWKSRHMLCIVPTLHVATAIYTLLLLQPALFAEQQFENMWMFVAFVVVSSILDLYLSIVIGLCTGCIEQYRKLALIGFILGRLTLMGGIFTLLGLILLSLSAIHSCLLLAILGGITYLLLIWCCLDCVEC